MTNREILQIIASEEIKDQSELLKKIQDRGYQITQSTLSRRLRQIGVKKKHGVYIPPNVVEFPTAGLLKRIDEAPPNLLILHTLAGHAHALAYQLDYISANDPEAVRGSYTAEGTGFPEIIGTIAGDDTVFVATRPEKLKELKQKIIKHWLF